MFPEKNRQIVLSYAAWKGRCHKMLMSVLEERAQTRVLV